MFFDTGSDSAGHSFTLNTVFNSYSNSMNTLMVTAILASAPQLLITFIDIAYNSIFASMAPPANTTRIAAQPGSGVTTGRSPCYSGLSYAEIVSHTPVEFNIWRSIHCLCAVNADVVPECDEKNRPWVVDYTQKSSKLDKSTSGARCTYIFASA